MLLSIYLSTYLSIYLSIYTATTPERGLLSRGTGHMFTELHSYCISITPQHLWVTDVVMGRETLNNGITVNMLGLRLVMGNIVLSLRSGGGDTLTRGLNEVRREINGEALRNIYIWAEMSTFFSWLNKRTIKMQTPLQFWRNMFMKRLLALYSLNFATLNFYM